MNLGGSRAVKPLSVSSSSTGMKSGDADQFPAGLRVLVVDDDPICLSILDKMLKKCRYEVTNLNRAEAALELLRENKTGFDIVISDVHMPDMDGFKLLECIGIEMDLPVIMMSVDDSKDVVMKGVTHGACDYLIKPVHIEALKNIWQHVVRKKKWKGKDFEQCGSVEDEERQQNPLEDADYLSSPNEGSEKNFKKRKDEEDDAEEGDDSSNLKRPRVVWSVELHQQFVAAVNQIGLDKAVPKKILELMNVPGLTRENVASHLQKFRLYLRRLSSSSQHQNGLGNSFLGTPDAVFGSSSSLTGLDLQSLAVSGQIPPQNLAAIQAAALGRMTPNSTISLPVLDQRNIFGFENPKMRFGEVHQQLNGRPKNVLHGIPTNMEPKQLATLHQSAETFGGMNMQVHSHASQSNSLLPHMIQPLSRTQMINEIDGNHVSGLPSSVGQPILPQAIPGAVLTQSEIDNVRGVAYPSISHPSAVVELSRNPSFELQGNRFALVSNPRTSTPTSNGGVLQEEVHSEMNVSRGFLPNYGVSSELNQNRTQDWSLQNVAPNFEHAQLSNIDQGFSSNQKSEQSRNTAYNVSVFPVADGGLGITPNALYPGQFGQDDLMNALLKRLQEGKGRVESE